MVSSFIFFILLYAIIELIYFWVADKYIIDKPNHRSSHLSITIRGGGIIFPVSFLTPFIVSEYNDWLLVFLALTAISLISFIDDTITLNNKIRFLIQSLSVAVLLMQVSNYTNLLLLIPLFIIIIGIINAYNFMDGINGITALYSLVTLGILFWIHHNIVYLLPDIYFSSLLAALSVFSFLNLRVKAKCFAGCRKCIYSIYYLFFNTFPGCKNRVCRLDIVIGRIWYRHCFYNRLSPDTEGTHF